VDQANPHVSRLCDWRPGWRQCPRKFQFGVYQQPLNGFPHLIRQRVIQKLAEATDIASGNEFLVVVHGTRPRVTAPGCLGRLDTERVGIYSGMRRGWWAVWRGE